MLRRRGWPALALLACLVVAIAGCGDSRSSTKDMSAKQVLSEVKIGMTEAQIKDTLGKPSGSFSTATGATASFLEYDSKDGTVAVSIDRGVVSGARALGPNDSEKPQKGGSPAGGGSAEDVPHQFGN